MEKIVCKNCGATEIKKNGFVFGVQRYQCKKCGLQFTKTSAHGKDARDKATALALCQLGISQNQVAKILSLTPTTIARWLKDFPKNIPYTFTQIDYLLTFCPLLHYQCNFINRMMRTK